MLGFVNVQLDLRVNCAKEQSAMQTLAFTEEHASANLRKNGHFELLAAIMITFT